MFIAFTDGWLKIVERRSAILASDDCIGLHANHMDLAKFDRSEAGYSRLRDRLFVWLNVERPERSVRPNSV